MRHDSLFRNAFRVGKVNDCGRRVSANPYRLGGVGDYCAYRRDNLVMIHALLQQDSLKSSIRNRWRKGMQKRLSEVPRALTRMTGRDTTARK